MDLSPYEGLHTVSFVWGSFNETGLSGYVDDITFHPVPEPSSAALLLVGLTVLAKVARRIRPLQDRIGLSRVAERSEVRALLG